MGEIRVHRRSYYCASCRQSTVPYDVWAGVESGMLTGEARRLAALAGSSWSFDIASDRLEEFCGLRISDQTIRSVCHAEGPQAAQWMSQDPALAAAYRQASGIGEFLTDGTSVNTIEGWREMRVNIFAKRESAAPVAPEQWKDRELPAATCRVAFAGITDCQTLGGQWGRWAEHLGVGKGHGLEMRADGAAWLWNQANAHLPHADQTVDVYHVSEHFHDCAKVLEPANPSAARQWADGQLLDLMKQRPLKYLRQLDAQRQGHEPGGSRDALDALYGYLSEHWERLEYGRKLREGRPIGSGMIEGGCKTIVGRRLKALSARWRPERAEHMANLCCLHYSDQWKAYWQIRNAA